MSPQAPSLSPLWWGFVLLALSRWPAALALAPCLSALRGPLALVLVALCVGSSLARAGRRVPSPWRDPGRGRLFAATAVLYLATGLWYTSRLRASGDEPHYLIMAQSLWREHDLDLRDNYLREDWREYTEGPLAPHYGAPRADGRPFPAHSPGLPFVLAPFYALGGRAACVVVLSLLASALCLEVRALARDATGDEGAALLAWTVAAGPPLAFYAFHIYTEVPSALCLALALRVLLSEAKPGAAVRAALSACCLPWLHVKLVPAAAALGLVAMLKLRGAARVLFVAVSLAMAAAYTTYYYAIFGSPSPLAIYGGALRDATGSGLRALGGLLLDRSFGLLPHAPAFLLAGAGVLASVASPRGAAGERSRLWPHALVAAAVLLPVLVWRMWWGGQCPPARFLLPMVPGLGVAVALRGCGPVRGLLRWRGALVGLGLGVLALAVADPGRLLLLNRGQRPTRLWAALSGEAAVARYLPSLTAPDPEQARVAWVWIVALCALLALDALARSRDAVDRLFRGVGLPLLLLLAVGVAVDGLARTGSRPTGARALTPSAGGPGPAEAGSR